MYRSKEIDAFRVSGVPELTMNKILSGVRVRRASSPKTVLAFENWTSAQLTGHFFYYPACGDGALVFFLYYPACRRGRLSQGYPLATINRRVSILGAFSAPDSPSLDVKT